MSLYLTQWIEAALKTIVMVADRMLVTTNLIENRKSKCHVFGVYCWCEVANRRLLKIAVSLIPS